MKTAVVLGDTHVPFHDEKALSVVYQITEALQPDVVVHVGDLCDCYKISRFMKDPLRLETLQEELDVAQRILLRIKSVSPRARRYLLEGNHERRLHKTICNLDGPARELARLSTVRSSLEWKALLQLRDSGFEFVEEERQPFAGAIPDLLLKHGSLVRHQSGYTARAEFERVHHSGLSGHTHRQALYTNTTHSGQHFWAEIGCTCKADKCDYIIGRPNWQGGFAVVSYGGGAPAVEMVSINAGKAIFRGEVVNG